MTATDAHDCRVWQTGQLPIPRSDGMVQIVGEDAAPAVTGGAHGFVPSLTSFVGRAGDAEKVAGLLGEYRLVTVTGPGGVGKTRLAGEVARRAAARFADGAWLVELTAVQDAALVETVVATALGVRQAPGLSVLESLAGVLSRRQLLLVLDNCEHVLGGVAELCGSLLPAADDLTVLATSREPIGMAGETRYRLRPLPVPGPHDPQAAADTSAAVQLFADRARQMDPGFDLAGEAKTAAVRVVARLDGMPLAIELAAARIEALGLSQLLDRIEDRFDLLASANRSAAPRQQSLTATVDWSYQLLSEHDRQVFRRLAVFPGPFTLDGAEVVAGAGAEPAVLHLVDCSLITPAIQGGNQLRLIDCLDECGFLCAATGRWAEAITLWAAYAARLQAIGVPDIPQEALVRHEPLSRATEVLGPDGMRQSEDRGAAMTLDTAAELAVLLSQPDPKPSAAPPGLPELSAREQELVVQVARGLTDAQIAEQLYISVSTVRSHLDRIRDKTSCRRRADLTRFALAAALV